MARTAARGQAGGGTGLSYDSPLWLILTRGWGRQGGKLGGVPQWTPYRIEMKKPGQIRAGFMKSFLVFLIGVQFFNSTSLPMRFVQKRAQKSTNIVLGCEVVTRTTSLPVDFVQTLSYNWLLRFCGLRPG